jgi:hypothetical protein
LRLGLLAGALVVVLVAGAAFAANSVFQWLWSQDADLAPFTEAVEALARTPGLTATSASVDGTVAIEARVTSTNEMTGRLLVDGVGYDVMSLGGQDYIRSDSGTLPGGPIGAIDAGSAELEASILAGRWVTTDLDELNPGWQTPPPPAGLAARLAAALADADLVGVDRSPADPVAGVATLVARTPAGAIHVTEAEPHTVIRFVPSATVGSRPGETEASRVGSPGAAEIVAAAGGSAAWSPDDVEESAPLLDPLDGGPLDIAGLSEEEVRSLFDELVTRTAELSDAAETALELSFPAPGSVDCGPGGCSFAATVVGSVRTTGQLLSATADVTMTVALFVEGAPAGTCTQRTQLPLDQPVPLSCSAPEAGAVFAAADARARAAALAATPPGGQARWSVAFSGLGSVLARADIDIAELRLDIEANRAETLCLADEASCAESATSPSTTGPSDPVDLSTINPRISRQKQERHLVGDPKYGGGGWLRSLDEAQEILDAVLAGRATILGRYRHDQILVEYTGVTGHNVNLGVGITDQPTNRFLIKGKSSPSIVATSPQARPLP